MQVREYPQFRLRLSPSVHAWIEEQAATNHRTKNAEISFRLERAMRETEVAAGVTGQG